MDSQDELLYKIENDLFSEHEKIDAIFELGDAHVENAVLYLISILTDKGGSIFVRTSAAMSLSKLKANEAVPVIMELIKSDEFSQNKGSLIYSLQSLDCKEHLMYFIDLLCTGGFEVRQMCEFIIEKYAADISVNEKKEALAILNSYHKRYELDMNIDDRVNRIEFIRETIELISKE